MKFLPRFLIYPFPIRPKPIVSMQILWEALRWEFTHCLSEGFFFFFASTHGIIFVRELTYHRHVRTKEKKSFTIRLSYKVKQYSCDYLKDEYKPNMNNISCEDQSNIIVPMCMANICQRSLFAQTVRTTLERNPVPFWASSSTSINLKV